MEHVRFGLLGPMEITAGGTAVTLPGAAERALLAQLLLSPGRTIPATMLVDRLWSESSLPVDPMNALQIRVSKLRRSLKAASLEDVVTREGVGYRANVAPESVDAVDFVQRIRDIRGRSGDGVSDLQAYDEALALWRGDPLSDFSGEQWAGVEAARLTELKLAALTERAQVALGLGRHLEVVTDLEPLVAADPTLEALAGLLMVALYRSGRQADALDVYSRTRDMLDESLGLEPSVSLRSLHERVLRQDESLGGHDAEVPAAAAPRRREEELAATTNLPTVVRPLIGRDAQLDSLEQLIGGVRLLSLIGPGGAGKTALALATVVRTTAHYRDGAFGVRLASVNTADQVPLAVAEALGVPLDGAAGDRDVRERLIVYLSRRHLLLLLDNCEHVVDAAAGLIDELLGRCPDVTVITTSREALAVPDEVQVTVGPLETAPADTPASELLAYPATQLLVERARAARPGMVFGEAELLALGRITRALDGIPLALELAGARVATMSPTEIADRLDQRFSLLTQGARTAEARQQTLRATVDWSYALLSPTEQRVFNRLSVFQGGWTLTAAEAVIADDETSAGEVLDTVGRLVERSMVVVEPGAVTRYRMLETLRQYAVERLSSEAPLVARRHAEHFAQFAIEAEQQLRGHGQREALVRLRAEQPNIRAALTWLGGPDGDLDLALAMAASLGLFWHLGRHLEGRELLARLLARATSADPAARALALQAESLVERPRACLVHPSPRCAETATESLDLFEQLGDQSRAALSRVLLAVEGVTGAHRERSDSLLAEAAARFEADGDAWGQGVIGFVRMETALKAGDPAVAVPIGRSTAAAFRALDDPWGLSAILYHLGWGLRQFGRYDEAARVLEEAIDVAFSAGLDNTAQWALADLGVCRLHQGDPAAAEEL
ncbi:MAG TPA: BTAD domain-containing putative transcriptional regulator, partial [Nocardioidaceae bacterium]|nr:BTAD domain-containing putative transcriptional regulator [Nocardioidaceae bacterium]